MTTQLAPHARDARTELPRRRASGSDLPVAVCLALVVAHACFRGWALFPSWFYTDDYRLLLQAEATPISLASVLKPFDSQFMPAGRLLSYLVHGSGELSWGVAAASTLVLSTAAALACVYMLVTLFGSSWHTTALVAVYVTTTLTTPAVMWWAAALNQVAPQALFFLAVAWWVRYLRTRRTRWGVAALAAVALALAFYVKAVLFLLVLAYLTLALAHGSLGTRVRDALRDHWRLVLPTVVAGATFGAWYATRVDQAYAGSERTQIAQVADSMLGTALPTGLLGGPWHWWNTNPPIVIADPPGWTVHLSWVIVALAIAVTLARRNRAWIGWVLIGSYAILDFLLLATSRGQEYGAFAGLDYRYLTDLAPVAVLGVGLATASIIGLSSGSSSRVHPYLAHPVPRRVVVVGTAVVCLGGIASSVGYVHFWHHENAGASYVNNLRSDLEGEGTYDLVNQTMPVEVMPGYTYPYNQTEQFVRLIHAEVSFPETSDRFKVVDGAGHLVSATVSPTISGRQGPREDCGWLVRQRPVTVPLETAAFDWGWWIEVRYLSSARTSMDVSAGGTTVSVTINSGLGSIMLHVTDEFESITFTPGDDDATVCVDSVVVGDVVPR